MVFAFSNYNDKVYGWVRGNERKLQFWNTDFFLLCSHTVKISTILVCVMYKINIYFLLLKFIVNIIIFKNINYILDLR